MESFLNSDSLDFEIQTDIHTLLENVRCQNGNALNQEQAYLALASLCSTQVEAQNYFYEIGGVEELVQNLTDGSCRLTLSPVLFCLACAVKGNVRSQNAVLTPAFLSVIHQILSSQNVSSKIAMATSFFIACSVSGSGNGQSLVFATHCLMDILKIFRTLITEESKDLNHWATITQAISFCIGNPQNEINQNACCNIIPPALKVIREYSHHKIIQNILSLIGLIVVNNIGNQNRFRSCGGLEILMDLVRQLRQSERPRDKLFHEVLASIVSALDLCVADNETSVVMTVDMDFVKHIFGILEEIPGDIVNIHIFLLALTHVFELAANPSRLMFECNGRDILVKHMAESQDEEVFKAIKYIFILCNKEDGADKEFLSMRNLDKDDRKVEKSNGEKHNGYSGKRHRSNNELGNFEDFVPSRIQNSKQSDELHQESSQNENWFLNAPSENVPSKRKSGPMHSRIARNSRWSRQEFNSPSSHMFQRFEMEKKDHQVISGSPRIDDSRCDDQSFLLNQYNEAFYEPSNLYKYPKKRETLPPHIVSSKYYPDEKVKTNSRQPHHRDMISSETNYKSHNLENASFYQDLPSFSPLSKDQNSDIYAQEFNVPYFQFPSFSDRGMTTNPNNFLATRGENQSFGMFHMNDQNFRLAEDEEKKSKSYHQPLEETNSLYGYKMPNALGYQLTSLYSSFQNMLTSFFETIPCNEKPNSHEINESKSKENFTQERNQQNSQIDTMNLNETMKTMKPSECDSKTLKENEACKSVSTGSPLKHITSQNKSKIREEDEDDDDDNETNSSASTVQYNTTKECLENIFSEVSNKRDIIKAIKSLFSLKKKLRCDNGIGVDNHKKKKKKRKSDCLSQILDSADQPANNSGDKEKNDQTTLARADTTNEKSGNKRTPCNLKRTKTISTIHLSDQVSEYAYSPEGSTNSNIMSEQCSYSPLHEKSRSLSKCHLSLPRTDVKSLSTSKPSSCSEDKNASPNYVSTSTQKKRGCSQSSSIHRMRNHNVCSSSPQLVDKCSNKRANEVDEIVLPKYMYRKDVSDCCSCGDCETLSCNKSTIALNSQRKEEIDQMRQVLPLKEDIGIQRKPCQCESMSNIEKISLEHRVSQTPHKCRTSDGRKLPATVGPAASLQTRLYNQRSKASSAFKTPSQWQSVKRRRQMRDGTTHKDNIDDKIAIYQFKSEDEGKMELSSAEYDTDASIRDPRHEGRDKFRRLRLPYTDQEILNLRHGVANMGTRWQEILCTYQFQKGRTAVDLKEKFKRLVGCKKKSVTKTRNSPLPFSKCEIKRLTRGVKMFGHNWKAILAGENFLPGRSAEDLRTKWRTLVKKE